MTEYIRYAKVSALKKKWSQNEYDNHRKFTTLKCCWKTFDMFGNFDKLYIAYLPFKHLKKFEKYVGSCIDSYDYFDYIDNEYGYVCGYMLLYRKDKNKFTQYIDLCDTFIPKLNLLEQMIQYFHNKNKNKIILHPKETIHSSNKYWIKYYQKYFNIHTKEDYIAFCQEKEIVCAVSY